MIYTISSTHRRIDININHIIYLERLKNPATVEDERVRLEMSGDIKYTFQGQEAVDFATEYVTKILPALGGLINP